MITSQPRILCVDDDLELLSITSEILSREGYEVIKASTGNEGLRLAKQEHPDLILLDVNLPDINGNEVCKQIKADATLNRERPDRSTEIISGSEELCGYSEEEFNSGRVNWLDLIHPEDRDRVLGETAEMTAKRLHIEQEYRIIRKDGELRYLIDRKVSRFTEGIFSGVDGIVFDVTGRKLAEEEIRKLNEDLRERIEELEDARILAEDALRARGEFLANISHELITPLNAIIGFSQILLDGLSGPMNELQKDYAASILQGGNRLHETLKEIVQFARLESGEMKLSRDRFLLRDLLQSSLLALNEKSLAQGVTLSLETGLPPETELEADREKLRQVMFSLLDNAVKFTPDGGSVQITARIVRSKELGFRGKKSPLPLPKAPTVGLFQRGEQERQTVQGEGQIIPTLSKGGEGGFDDYIEISVADTGIGIKSEDLPRLFRPFQQLESPYTKKYRGTGLGLILAQKLIELHNGRIWVKSEFGKGSTFTFAIPMRQNQNSESSCQ